MRSYNTYSSIRIMYIISNKDNKKKEIEQFCGSQAK